MAVAYAELHDQRLEDDTPPPPLELSGEVTVEDPLTEERAHPLYKLKEYQIPPDEWLWFISGMQVSVQAGEARLNIDHLRRYASLSTAQISRLDEIDVVGLPSLSDRRLHYTARNTTKAARSLLFLFERPEQVGIERLRTIAEVARERIRRGVMKVWAEDDNGRGYNEARNYSYSWWQRLETSMYERLALSEDEEIAGTARKRVLETARSSLITNRRNGQLTQEDIYGYFAPVALQARINADIEEPEKGQDREDLTTRTQLAYHSGLYELTGPSLEHARSKKVGEYNESDFGTMTGTTGEIFIAGAIQDFLIKNGLDSHLLSTISSMSEDFNHRIVDPRVRTKGRYLNVPDMASDVVIRGVGPDTYGSRLFIEAKVNKAKLPNLDKLLPGWKAMFLTEGEMTHTELLGLINKYSLAMIRHYSGVYPTLSDRKVVKRVEDMIRPDLVVDAFYSSAIKI